MKVEERPAPMNESRDWIDLLERREYITSRIQREEERFLETLSKGLKLLEDEIRNRPF